MIKDIYDYFENLDKKKLPRNRHNLIFDNDQIKKSPTEDKYGMETRPLTIDGTHYFEKGYNYWCSITDIASTNMYNAIGIPTPPIYTIEKHPSGIQQNIELLLASQDVHSVDSFLFSIAKEILSKQDIKNMKIYSTFKWGVLYDSDIKRVFLKHMTQECFDQLIGLFLIDEIRTDRDRHDANYFFYKDKTSEKYEGILPIDNELLSVIQLGGDTKQSFDSFLYTPYPSAGLFGYGDRDFGTYKNRIQDIKELLQDQMLTPAQIELIKRAIKYNLPAEIKKVSKNPLLGGSSKHLSAEEKKFERNQAKTAYDAVSRLWEYHHKELGRELDI